MEFTNVLSKISERRLTVVLLFAAFLIAGILIFKDYGVSWDEEATRTQNGLTNYNFIFHHDKENLLHSAERFHGPVFEIFLFTMERAFHITEIRTVYLFRHFATFLLFFISSIFMFLLSKNIFKKQSLAILTLLMYVLSPRIFGDSFFNSKDIPFLSLFTISLFTLQRFIENKNFRNALLHILVCGVMIDIRITGVIIPLFTIAIFLIDYITAKRDEAITMLGFKGRLGFMITRNGTDFRPYMISRAVLFLVSCFVFLVLQFAFIVLFWPLLWLQPLKQFVLAWQEMSHYPWVGDVLYLGRLVKSTKLPWHYAPVWMLITIPFFYIVFFTGGVFSLLTRRISFSAVSKKFLYVAAALFLFPLVSVILFHSILYDGWRHLYFLYAPFVLVATNGIEYIYGLLIEDTANRTITNRKLVFASVIGFCFLFTSVSIVAEHPYQQTFFNYPAKKLLSPGQNFETDYWGLSYRQAFEDILKMDTASQVNVHILMGGQLNAQILNPKDRDRIVFHGDEREADFNLLLFLGRGGRDGRHPVASSRYPLLKEITSPSGALLAICKGKRSEEKQEIIFNGSDTSGVKLLGREHFGIPVKYAVDSVGKNEIEEVSVECMINPLKPNPNVMLVFTVNREDTNCVKKTIYWEAEQFQSTLVKRYFWSKVRWNVNIPRNSLEGDTASAYVWSPSDEPVLIKDFKMKVVKYSQGGKY